HEQRAIQRTAYDNGVIVHVFPSKTIHKIQPLDVSVFSSIQHAWIKHCDKCLANGVEIDHYNFIHKYMAIHHIITPELIQKAFKKTGIYPLDLSVLEFCIKLGLFNRRTYSSIISCHYPFFSNGGSF
ncbi:hypothetical protein CY34DRAFT_99332, partial [Suillus luteus UH-Slu-Lm8-n1]